MSFFPLSFLLPCYSLSLPDHPISTAFLAPYYYVDTKHGQRNVQARHACGQQGPHPSCGRDHWRRDFRNVYGDRFDQAEQLQEFHHIREEWWAGGDMEGQQVPWLLL